MKFWITSILLCLVFSLAGQQQSLKVKVSNIIDHQGQIIVTLYNKAEGFAKSGNEFKKIISQKVLGSIASIKVDDLPPGDYSVIILHDKNQDGECNYNFIGMPVEGYGFSNNVVPRLSVPSFNQTMFSFPEEQEISIELIH